MGPILKGMREFHTDTDVHFRLEFVPGKLQEVIKRPGGIEEFFGLSSTIKTSNMVCFDAAGRLQHYSSPESIVQAFYDVRLLMYRNRKDMLLKELTEEWDRLGSKARFISMVVDGTLVVSRKAKAVLIADLEALHFPRMTKTTRSREALMDASAEGGKDGEMEASAEGR